ncbi:MAG TPA: RNA methyltransferase [Actinopolymorphaceae bacterium]
MSEAPPGLPVITSKLNPLVKDFLALRRSARRRRIEQLSLVEGFKILKLALDAGSTPAVVLYSTAKMTDEEYLLLERARRQGATVREVTEPVLTKVSAREGPLGCVASVRVAETDLSGLKLSPNPLLVVMEGLEKPGNLGSLARTASAGGADALITADSQTDIYSPATIHASLGSVFDLPVVRCSTQECIPWLQSRGIEIVATTPGAKSAYYELDLSGPVALAIGNEHRGLSPAWLEAGTHALIPMTGSMNSLNATIAGGIVLFEALRQRAVAEGSEA